MMSKGWLMAVGGMTVDVGGKGRHEIRGNGSSRNGKKSADYKQTDTPACKHILFSVYDGL